MSFRPLPLQHQNESDNGQNPPLSAKTLTASMQDERRHRVLWAWAALVLAAMAAIFATRASGQAANFPYDSIPMHPALKDKDGNEDEAKIKQVQTATKNYVSTGKGNPKLVAGYYSFIVPAKMTGPDCLEHISELVDETNQFLSRAQRSNRVQVAQELTKAVLVGMQKVAEGNHHPAARISAALILSRLDRQLADTANRVPPVPLTTAVVPILLGLYEDENNVDGLRAAALQGLHRQVMYGFPQLRANEKQALTSLSAELIDADPPQGRSPDAHAYLQRFAVDILAMLRPNQDKTLGVKLISISTEPSNHDLIALHSAARLGAMAKELQGQVDAPEAVLESWSRRALAAFEAELARFQAFERPKPARTQPKKPESFLVKAAEVRRRSTQSYGEGMDEDMMEMDYEDMMDGMDYQEMDEMDYEGMMGMEYGMMGMRPEAKPQPPEVIASRQKLNHVLQQLHLGVTGAASAGLPTREQGGLLGSVADDKKEVVETWVTTMETIVTAINDEMLDDQEKYVTGLEDQIAALRAFIGIEEEQVEAERDAEAEIFGVEEVEMAAPGAGKAAAPVDEPAAAGEPAPTPAPAPSPAPAPAAEQATADEPAPVDELAAP
jgi:hypothetical protein